MSKSRPSIYLNYLLAHSAIDTQRSLSERAHRLPLDADAYSDAFTDPSIYAIKTEFKIGIGNYILRTPRRKDSFPAT